MLYRRIAKPILFKMDPERAHHLTIEGLKKTSSVPGAIPLLRKMYGFTPDPRLKTKVCDISFPHPIGLAAGLDKNGQVVKGFSSIGFGFVEVGTVTPKPQPGNDLPRLFRLPEDQALINRMGFNNLGTAQMAKNLTEAGKYTIPVAVNIGKNKTTPNTEAESDYRKCIQDLYDYGTFFVVNISSPNTPDLRKLQHGEELYRLLSAVTDEMDIQRKKRGEAFKPIFVKIAPDLNEEEMKDIIEIISRTRISGIIATNTTLSREGLRHHHQREAGGLSGRPLTRRSTEMIRMIYQQTEGKIPIIGVGGIFTAEDAYEKIRAGASLVEIYTALIYKGPGLLKELHDGLLKLMTKDRFEHLSQAVGADLR